MTEVSKLKVSDVLITVATLAFVLYGLLGLADCIKHVAG